MINLVNKITLSQEDKQSFSENGFIKLKQLFTSEATDKLRKLTSNTKSGYNRLNTQSECQMPKKAYLADHMSNSELKKKYRASQDPV
ncbi:MAG: hypothetical protein F6K26_55795, partial [Moorea sp. SIO2I5]|nr:hypothetical protein [Moorena sp. SIO2I5]